MLGDSYSRPCHDKRSRRRDVECAGSVASCAAGIHQQFIGARRVRKNRRRMTAHRAGEAHQFLDCFALGAQRGEQRDDRVLIGLAGENLLQGVFSLLPRKMPSGFYFFDERLHHEFGRLACWQRLATDRKRMLVLFAFWIRYEFTCSFRLLGSRVAYRLYSFDWK